MISRRNPTTALGALVVLAIAGCAPAPGPSPDVVAPVSPAPSGSFVAAGPDAPVEFVERIVLPACGHEKLGRGEAIPDAAVECLTDPGREGAELIVSTPADHGGTVTTYYRALPDGSMEVFADATGDLFGDREWSRAVCPSPVSIRDQAGCTEDAPEGDHEMEQ